MTDTPIVTQADIDAAKLYLQGAGPWKLDEIGIGPDDSLVQAFARHRIASTAELTEALRTISDDNCLDPWAVAREALAKAGGQ